MLDGTRGSGRTQGGTQGSQTGLAKQEEAGRAVRRNCLCDIQGSTIDMVAGSGSRMDMAADSSTTKDNPSGL